VGGVSVGPVCCQVVSYPCRPSADGECHQRQALTQVNYSQTNTLRPRRERRCTPGRSGWPVKCQHTQIHADVYTDRQTDRQTHKHTTWHHQRWTLIIKFSNVQFKKLSPYIVKCTSRQTYLC